MINFSSFDFAPIMDYPDRGQMKVFDLTGDYDPEYVESFQWGIGKYDERRPNMYTAPQYKNARNIHMGIDIWSEAGQPVYSFYDGTICYKAYHNQRGNYGPTLVLQYKLNSQKLFALYGHLSRTSLNDNSVGERVEKSQQIATVGLKEENGDWVPHLHFQLSWQDPGKADMPGVVSKEEHQKALKSYPDPQLVTGYFY
jgi:murein DD-endopeptidase MepM/ murein hydrolase activator NlpD